jgi:hypothetical protein
MNLDQQLADLAKRLGAGALVVDEAARRPVLRGDPAQNHLAGPGLQPQFVQQSENRVFAIRPEDCRDRTLPPCRSDKFAPGLAPQRKAQRVEQNGFPGPGLAGEDIQAGMELQRQRLDQNDVPDLKAQKHRAPFPVSRALAKVRAICPGSRADKRG